MAYNQHKFISHCSEVCKAMVRVPALSDSGENAFPGCRLLTLIISSSYDWKPSRGSKLPCHYYKCPNPSHDGLYPHDLIES